MNVFQICSNTSDLIPLYLPLDLYLKPITKLSISIRLSKSKKVGKSISYWEIMDKLRDLIKPEEFTTLKVTRTTIEFVSFEGELEVKAKLDRVMSKLDNKMIKLKDFNELLRIRAEIWKSDFPTQKVWDDFFENAKDMNEMKNGERPDTVHLSNLPTKWFTSHHVSDKEALPSEKLFQRIFEKFGAIRIVDIPMSDPFRKKMNDQISGVKNCSLDNNDFFEAYIQFKDYVSFKVAMDAMYNKKLVHKDTNVAEEVNIKVDFDRSKHLSDASIRRREIVRERLISKAQKKEEKERAEMAEKKQKESLEMQKQLDVKEQKLLRRKLREEKRKAKILQKLEIGSTDEINSKIAKEEKKLLKVQRKLEAIRLVEELYRRIKDKNPKYANENNTEAESADELKKLKTTSEREVYNQTEKLKNALKGREMLKAILSKDSRSKPATSTSSSDTELSLDEPIEGDDPPTPVLDKYPELLYNPHWIGLPYPFARGFPGPAYPGYAGTFRGFVPRRRPYGRYPNGPRTSRGSSHGRRGSFNRHWNSNRQYNEKALPLQDLEKACRNYFHKFLDEENRGEYSSSRSRNRHRSYSRSYSSSRSRSGSRSRSRNRSHSRSRYRSDRSHSRSREKSKRRSRSRTKSRSKSKRRSKSKEQDKGKDRFEGRTPSPHQAKHSRQSTPSQREKHRTKSSSRSPG